jgi:hypothetical protein
MHNYVFLSQSVVSIEDNPFNVGGRTVVRCTTALEAITSLVWINANGVILASTTQNQLDLVFDPVTDDLSQQGVELTCRLISVGRTQTQSLQIVLLRKCVIF